MVRRRRLGVRRRGDNFGVDGDRRRREDLQRQVETLSVAVERRTGIGMALGIIMERLHLDDEQAFSYLSRCSQVHNRKLYELALEVVQTRELPASRPVRGA